MIGQIGERHNCDKQSDLLVVEKKGKAHAPHKKLITANIDSIVPE